MTARAAFFDLDGTLTPLTTLFRFLAHDLARRGRPHREYREARERLRELTRAGVPRSETNRAYVALFAGRDAAELARIGEEWFRAELAAGSFFSPLPLTAFVRHGMAGDLRVIVSGSFPPCLDPVVRYLGAEEVLCARPETVGGRLTGRLARPMIGARKADAVRELARRRDIDLSASAAYGDHDSDLDLLQLVGHPVVVGADPAMVALAGARDWRRLPHK